VSTAFDVADAVAAELNGGSGSGLEGDFTAVVKPVPAASLADLAVMTVSVVPKSVELQALTRGSRVADVTIDIGVQKKVSGDLPADCAEPLALVQSILEFLWKRPLATMPAAHFVSARNDPVFDPDHLRQLQVFTGVVSVTYRV
jgi:hypothetical protein